MGIVHVLRLRRGSLLRCLLSRMPCSICLVRLLRLLGLLLGLLLSLLLGLLLGLLHGNELLLLLEILGLTVRHLLL